MTNRSKLDVLFINPGSRRENYQLLGTDLAAIEPPLWAGLLAGHVRQKGFSATIIDANAENLSFDETARLVADADPRLVVIVIYGQNPSASTQTMPAAHGIASAIKLISSEINILMIGGHVAALPEQTLREEQIDFVSDGEGPQTVIDLLNELSAARPDFNNVRDLWYRTNDTVVRSSKKAPLVTDLDKELSGVAWDLLPMEKYRAHNWHCFGESSRQPYASMYTSLGCPFSCTFCCINAPFRSGEQATDSGNKTNRYRMWSPAFVVRELAMLSDKYGIVNIKFADELFVLKEPHVTAICRGIIDRGLKLNIWAYARVDTLAKVDLLLLKKAGINWLALGIESASERVRDDCNKGYKSGDVRPIVELIKAAGINVIGNFLFGLPEDTHETMQETLALALELNCEFVNFNCAMAYPGSELHEHAIKEKWPLPDTWNGYAQLSTETTPLPTRHLTGGEVLAFRDKAFQRYFSSEKYLAMIEGKFGKEAREQLWVMTSIPIVRKYISP